MKSIAEWVEDSAAVETLYRLGVDYLQGYAIAKPQQPNRILLAESCANLVEDQSVLRFVRETLSAHRTMGLWEEPTSTRLRASMCAS